VRRADGLTSNEEYWALVRHDRLYEGAPVRLSGFHLTEWVPLTPGRFHSPEAARARDLARYHIDSVDPLRGVGYLPQGKRSMTKGGIGTVRLPALDLHGRPLRVLAATSDGVCHSGVPLVLGADQYESVIPQIRERGGVVADVSGVMPRSATRCAGSTATPGVGARPSQPGPGLRQRVLRRDELLHRGPLGRRRRSSARGALTSPPGTWRRFAVRAVA
jgi:hypothetical protein